MRKLVLETGKFNVLTAHSTREAVDLFHLFPNISGVVLAEGEGLDCDGIANIVKSTTDKLPVICLSPHVAAKSGSADQTISSHEPEALLMRMRELFGDPRQIDRK